MNIKLIKFLVSACIGLCLIIAGEWLYASYRQHRLLTSISSEKLKDYKTDELPKIELTKQPEESYVDLVARPLFIEGRKPVNEPSPEEVQAAAKSESFDWQLNGVYSTKKTISALFSRSKSKVAKDNYRKITVGDDLDGWKLTEINKDRVMLKQGGNEKELLLRKPKLKALPPAAKSPKPTAPAPAPASVPAAAPEPAEDNEDTTEDTSENNQ
ncbi:MAG: hypothetical protein PHF31_14090 [Methylobacter sp.]|nr:hypothetical protein [Methylobacter sp.]